MKCKKCKRDIPDNSTVCPHCRKVLALECPNCHSIGDSPVCTNCGYIILTKCSKCGKTVSTSAEKCKCGFPVNNSIAYQECESDEFASVTISFTSLKQIRKILGTQELFTKFFFKLRNLLVAQFSGIEGKIINYNDVFVVNFNKELSFATSANKAVRFALKIANALSSLNLKVVEEFAIPLKLNISITKKLAVNLLKNSYINNNVKLLTVKKDENKYLKGMQIILDQYVRDEVDKDIKTDSLFTIEDNGLSLMFYEILLESYVIPPSASVNQEPVVTIPKYDSCSEKTIIKEENNFKVFDISAKCKFENSNAVKIFDNFNSNKIISLRSLNYLGIKTSNIIDFYRQKKLRVLHIVCTEELNYTAWGIFQQIFREYYNLSLHNSFIPEDFSVKHFNVILDLLKNKPQKANTPEDARFAYIDTFCNFLATLKNCVILIENFEYIDDSTIQTLELFFDSFKNSGTSFVFTTNNDIALHSKIKGLLRNKLYTEYTLQNSGMEDILSKIKEEASDFINSFYFEKIKEYFNGSYLYFDAAIKFLKEKNVLISFENRLLLKNKKSVILPNNYEEIQRARLKQLGKDMDASMILAYSTYLGYRIGFEILSKLGIKDVETAVKKLCELEFAYCENNILYINNYNLIKPVIEASIKPQVNEFLSKNILANIASGLSETLLIFILGKLSIFKEEYLLLWKNSQLTMAVGDYDAYLKNCQGFLSLIEHISGNIAQIDIEANKKEVYQNILMSLYNYSPAKIYNIEKFLLEDAFEENNDEKISRLSNLMLQGALISANYTEAPTLLHNILSRLEKPTLIVDGAINTKFLLLSLINIEILFNIGEFGQCVETAKDILTILKPNLIDKIKPASFSTNLFVGHLMETFRLAAFAKLFLMDNEIEEFLELIKSALDTELPDKECILAIKDFISGKNYQTGNVECATPFAKVVYLILQEFENNATNYNVFAQNIYQAKLLAADIHQKQLEIFCEILIANSYANINCLQKAEKIYDDILNKAQKTSLFGVSIIAKYFIAKLYIKQEQVQKALLLVNDTLAILQNHNNQFKIMYFLFEKLFIEIAQNFELSNIDIEIEEQKLAVENENGQYSRFMS